MPVTAATVLEYIVKMSVNSQVLLNTFHWKLSDPIVPTDELDACNGFLSTQETPANGFIPNDLRPMMGTNVTLLSHSAQIVYPTRFVKVENVLNLACTRVGICSAQNVAAVFERRGRIANKHNVGSSHVGGLVPTDYVSGLVTNGYKAVAANYLADLQDPVVDPGSTLIWIPCVLNKEPIPLTDPVKFRISGASPITSARIQDQLRTMRRRTVGLGI